MSTLTTYIQSSIERPSHCNRARKGNKGIQIGKKEKKLSYFQMTSLPMQKTPRSLPISCQKYQVQQKHKMQDQHTQINCILYTSKKTWKPKLKHNTIYNWVHKRNLTKHMQHLCTEDYKGSRKESKEDLKEQTDISYSWIGRLTIVKMLIFSPT